MSLRLSLFRSSPNSCYSPPLKFVLVSVVEAVERRDDHPQVRQRVPKLGNVLRHLKEEKDTFWKSDIDVNSMFSLDEFRIGKNKCVENTIEIYDCKDLLEICYYCTCQKPAKKQGANFKTLMRVRGAAVHLAPVGDAVGAGYNSEHSHLNRKCEQS
jgi:hypothetical protein